MPDHLSVRAAGLLVVVIMLSGCSFWSWPYPRVVENTEGLGDNPIGNFFRERGIALVEDDRKAAVVEFIQAQTYGKQMSRKEAEALGFQCAPPPRTECTYAGERWRRLEHISPSSPHYGMRTIVRIQVRLSYLKPRELIVQVDEHDIPEE